MVGFDYEEMKHFAKMIDEQFDQEVEEDIKRIQQRNTEYNRVRYGCPDCDLARCYTTCPRYLTNCEPEELFRWWGKTSPPDRKEREVLPPGGPSKKGGSKSGKKRKKPPKFYINPFISS